MTEAGLCALGGTARVVHQKDQSLNPWTLGVASVLCFRKNRCLPRKILETPTLHLYKQCQGKEKKQTFLFLFPDSLLQTTWQWFYRGHLQQHYNFNEKNKEVQCLSLSLLVMFVISIIQVYSHVMDCWDKRPFWHFNVALTFVPWK